MSKLYGITKEPSTFNTTSNSYEMGWAFKVKQKIYLRGFRVKFPSNQTVIANLWDYNTTSLLCTSSDIVVTKSNTWIECLLKTPIVLEAEKNYIITTYNTSNRYYASPNNFTFNTDYIIFLNGRYGYSKGSYPSYTENMLYPLIDLIFTTSLAKYLVSSEDKYYTVINSKLSELNITEPLTASIFEEYGVDEISSDLLKTLVNPRLYAWYEDGYSSDNLKCGIKATPKPQILYSDKCDLTDETIKGVENIESIFEGSPLLAMSFDEKQTWEAFNGTEWVTLSEDTTGSIPNVYGGLSVDKWAEKLNGVTSIYFRVVIPTAADKVTSIKLNFLN